MKTVQRFFLLVQEILGLTGKLLLCQMRGGIDYADSIRQQASGRDFIAGAV